MRKLSIRQTSSQSYLTYEVVLDGEDISEQVQELILRGVAGELWELDLIAPPADKDSLRKRTKLMVDELEIDDLPLRRIKVEER